MNTLCRAILMTVAGALVWLSIVVAVQSTPPPRDPCSFLSFDYGVVEIHTNKASFTFGWDKPVVCDTNGPRYDLPVPDFSHYVFTAETIGLSYTSLWEETHTEQIPAIFGTNRYSIRAVYTDGGESAKDYLSIVNLSTNPVLENLLRLGFEEGEGTITADLSGAGNSGTLCNGALFDADTPNGSKHSVRLDGTDDYIDVGVIDVDGAGLTLACWYNADTYPGTSRDPRLISKATGTAADDHIFMLGTIGSGSSVRVRGRVRVNGTTTTLIANSGNLGTGQWYHTALTYDGSQLRLYLDGVEVGSMALTGAVDTDSSVRVAIGAQPPGAGGRYFDGLLDDVRVLQRGLSATEVAGLTAENELPSPPSPPTGLRIVDAGATQTTGWFRAEFSKDWADWQSVAWRVQYEEQAE